MLTPSPKTSLHTSLLYLSTLRVGYVGKLPLPFGFDVPGPRGRNKCHASSNKKLLGTSAPILLVTTSEALVTTTGPRGIARELPGGMGHPKIR